MITDGESFLKLKRGLTGRAAPNGKNLAIPTFNIPEMQKKEKGRLDIGQQTENERTYSVSNENDVRK